MPAKSTTKTTKSTKSAKVAKSTNTTEPAKQPAKKWRFGFWQQVWLTSAVVGLLLLVANSAVFVNQYIFDTNNFTNTAVTSITSESSRNALASEVVDRALADRPVVKNVVGGTATKLISGLFDTNQFNRVLYAAVSRLQIYLTSNEQKSVAIDLTGVKSTVDKLVGFADALGAEGTNAENVEQRVSQLPDQLTLINADNIPSFYTYGLIFLWLAPLCVLGSLALLAYPYIRDRRQYYKVAAVQGAMVALFGALSLLVGPLFRPPALANVASPNMRVVVGNLYDAFINYFNQQAYIVIALGLALALLPWLVHLGLGFYSKRRA